MTSPSSFLRIAGACVLLALTACAGKPPIIEIPVDDVLLQGTVTASADINAASDGTPSPLLVRVYELSSDDVFNSVDFFTLFDNEPAVLGAGLLRVRDVSLLPGQVVPLSGEADPRVQVIGVVGAFRELDGKLWRVSAPVPVKIAPLSQPHRVAVTINASATGLAIQLAPIPPEAPPSDD